MIRSSSPCTPAKGNLFKPLCQDVNRRKTKFLLLKSALLYPCIFTVSCMAAFESLNLNATDRLLTPSAIFKPVHNHFISIERQWRFGLSELSINRFDAFVFHDGLIGSAGWSYTGDDKYNESIVHIGCGLRWKNLAGMITLQNYNVIIEGYGSANCLGENIELHCKPVEGIVLSCGSVGLTLTGNSTLQDAIEPVYWASIEGYHADILSVIGMIERSRINNTSLSIATRFLIIENVQAGFSAGENPVRAGFMFTIQIEPFSVSIFSTSTHPLGWVNSLRFGYQW